MLAGTFPKSISRAITGRGSETATRYVGTVDRLVRYVVVVWADG